MSEAGEILKYSIGLSHHMLSSSSLREKYESLNNAQTGLQAKHSYVITPAPVTL